MSRIGSGAAVSRVVKTLLGLAACSVLLAGLLVPVADAVTRAIGQEASGTGSCGVTLSPAPQRSQLLASDGHTVIATFYAQNRQDIALSSVPTVVQRALIDTEDRTFYSNSGVDARSLARAALADIEGGTVQGGSTLTMQYVKEFQYYAATTPAERQAAVQQDLARKLIDARCAIQITSTYSKRQILQAYLNISYFGQNAYGIQAAAQTYFGIPAARLDLAQAAMLVGLLQSPSSDDPVTDPQAALARRAQVLQAMVDAGDLSAPRAEAIASGGLSLNSGTGVGASGCAGANPNVLNAGFFCDYTVSWLQQNEGISLAQLQTHGLSIVTTLNANLQNQGQRAVWNSGLQPSSPTALVMPSVDPASGAVQTFITSRHYGFDAARGETTLPLFTAAYASSGSTYKYFTAIAALQAGATPNLTLTTGSTAYTVRECPNSSYTTHNAGTYPTTLTLQDALAESVNTYFVGLEDQVFHCDLTPIVNVALGLGMTALDAPQGDAGLSIAQAVVAQHQAGFTLGFSPTSALQLAGAYSAAADDGVFCTPRPVDSITVAGRTEPTVVTSSCTQQFSAQIAHTMVAMMTADTASGEGTASAFFQAWYLDGGSAVASKTGTDNDDPNGPDGGTGNSALWFVGVTPHLVAAAALVDPAHPEQTVSGLPVGVLDPGSDVFGAYASTFWLDAYGPTLSAHPWTWPFPPITLATPTTAASPAGRPTSSTAASPSAAAPTSPAAGSSPGSGSPSATPSPSAVTSPAAASPSDVSSSP